MRAATTSIAPIICISISIRFRLRRSTTCAPAARTPRIFASTTCRRVSRRSAICGRRSTPGAAASISRDSSAPRVIEAKSCCRFRPTTPRWRRSSCRAFPKDRDGNTSRSGMDSAVSHSRMATTLRSRKDVDAWFEALGSGLDGVVAKRVDLPYQSGERTGMQKYKRMRSADCVVGGFRYGTNSKLVGSLLLGLFDDHGLLHHVGFASNIAASERDHVTRMLETLIGAPGFTGRAPGGPSRWSTERTGEWQPLKTKLVVEVQYDQFSSDRFRHGTKLLRWRPDKAPRQCTLAQVEQESAQALALLDPRARKKAATLRRSA